MNSRISSALSGWRILALLSVCSALVGIFTGTAAGQANASASHNEPVGTWLVELTLRDCESGVPLAPLVNTLVTVHRGGTISESTGPSSFVPGQRTSGHGTLTQVRGRTYRQRMIWLILFDTQPNLPGTPGFDPALPISPGFFTGWQEVTHTVEFKDADHGMSAGTNEFYKTNGELYRSGCSTTTLRRFR